VHIPVDITDPTLTEFAAQVLNQLHALLGKPSVAAGDRNPYYDAVTQIGVADGAAVDRSTPLAACGPVGHLERVPLSLIGLVVAVGGDVEGLPVWFELSNDPATIDCPFSDATPKEKWSTWGTFGASHVPQKIGPKWYRSNAVGQSGRLMNASQWASQSSIAVSLKDYKAIQAEYQVGP